MILGRGALQRRRRRLRWHWRDNVDRDTRPVHRYGADGGLPTRPAGLPLAVAGESLSLYAMVLVLVPIGD
jgi:hypothetical protein